MKGAQKVEFVLCLQNLTFEGKWRGKQQDPLSFQFVSPSFPWQSFQHLNPKQKPEKRIDEIHKQYKSLALTL